MWLFFNPEDLPIYLNLIAGVLALLFAIIAAGEKVVIRLIDSWDKIRDYFTAKQEENQQAGSPRDENKKDDEKSI